MHKQNKRLPTFALICALSLALAAVQGCATHSRDVGVAVVAPKVQLPPVPSVVQQTQAKPAGYFQSLLSDFFSASPAKPTK